MQPKYIGKLLEKAQERAREHDIVYERQLAKERQKEDHLFGDKEKFVTGAYKKKLQEQAKWLEEERHKELREQQNEVCLSFSFSFWFRVRSSFTIPHIPTNKGMLLGNSHVFAFDGMGVELFTCQNM